ncbi:MAG: class I SAM-dependent methyltransferase [Chloroflexota bacterium]
MTENDDHDWNEFYALTSDSPPWPTLLYALDSFDQEQGNLPKVSVDLGSGAGRDTIALLKRGWEVLAIDAQPESAQWLEKKVSNDLQDKLTTLSKPFEEVTLPTTTLVNASYSLPFCAASEYDGLWEKIINGILSGGRFSGHFFGDNDQWAHKPLLDSPTYHQTRAQVEDLFQAFEIEYFDERDEDGTVADGTPKHWHIFSVVAKKK